MQARILLVTTAAFLLSAATLAQDVRDRRPAPAAPTQGFQPVEPEMASSQVEIVVGGTIVRSDIRLLSDEEQLQLLSTTRSSTRVAKVNANGSLSYLTGTLTGERGKYAVFMDHANYFVEPIVEPDGKVIGRYKTGIGLRLVASVDTKSRGIDLGSLFKIGLAVSRQEMSGSLEVVAFGVNGPQIAPLLPGIMPTIDESSIQKALESMAAVKAKFWEADTTISPSYFAAEYFERPSTERFDPPRLPFDGSREGL